MNALEVRGISKSFKDVKAVQNVSFSIESGKIFGILGPNGAGKTTTIRMIAGVILPDEGEIEVLGTKDVQNIQNRIGYLPEERGLYKKMKVLDQLIYFGELKEMRRKEAEERGRYWLKQLDASDWVNKRIQELSKGMQQKVQFVSTLLHDPDILILDEPFSGFDPINVEVFKQIILDLKAQGKTILLSTHNMEQAEQLCDEVCLINKGKIVLSGSIVDIKSQRANDTVVCEYYGSDDIRNLLSGVKILSYSQNRIEFRFDHFNFDLKEFLKNLVERVEVKKIEFMAPSLREIFIEEVTKIEN